MKMLIAILLISILLLPLLVYLAKRAYKALCLATSRSEAEDAMFKLELIIKFLFIDILVLMVVVIFIHDL